MQIGTIQKIAHSYCRSNAHVSQAFEMIDQILSREKAFRHRASDHVLEAVVTVKIGHCGHHRLATQVDMCGPRRRFQFTLAPDLSKPPILSDKSRILDRAAAISGDKPCSFEDDMPVERPWDLKSTRMGEASKRVNGRSGSNY